MKNRFILFILLICISALLFCGCAGRTNHPESVETDAAAGTSVSVIPEDGDSDDPAGTPSAAEAADPAAPAEPEEPAEAEEPAGEQSGEEAGTPDVYEHVVIIGVDGAGAFFKDADMPKLESILKNGARTYGCLTSDPTISAQCWGSMLIGVTPDCHRLSNSYIESNPYPADSIFPTVFRVVREAMPDAVLGSFCNWNPINVGIIEDSLGVTKDTAPGDKALTDKICAYVAEEKPTLLFVQFDEVDGAGHGSGYGTKNHLAQLHTEDGYIDRIYTAYKDAGILDDTLFIVAADHGGNGTSHGGWTDAEKYVMWAAAGKTVIPGGEIEDMAIRDTASVVLMALGLADLQPGTWTSRVPSGLFRGVEAGERPVYTVTYQYGHRTHESTPTPDPAGVDSAVSLFGEKRVLAYLPFDGDADSVCGIVTTEAKGKLYYVDGYFGSGAQFDDGYVSLDGYQPDTDSFSVCFWMKTGGVSSDPCLFSNKDWNSGSNKGFVLSLRDTDVKFNLGNGGSRMDEEYPLPLDYKDGWVYVILSVDRKNEEIRFSYDFGALQTAAVSSSLAGGTFKGLKMLNIGQDGTGKYGQRLGAVLDEFLLIEGTLTDKDVAALKAKYGN